MKKDIIDRAERLRQGLNAELASIKRDLAKLERAGIAHGTIYENERGYMMFNTMDNGRRKRTYLGKPGCDAVKEAKASMARHRKHTVLLNDRRNVEHALERMAQGIEYAIFQAKSFANGQRTIRK